jgi:hypothetical protein
MLKANFSLPKKEVSIYTESIRVGEPLIEGIGTFKLKQDIV